MKKMQLKVTYAMRNICMSHNKVFESVVGPDLFNLVFKW